MPVWLFQRTKRSVKLRFWASNLHFILPGDTNVNVLSHALHDVWKTEGNAVVTAKTTLE